MFFALSAVRMMRKHFLSGSSTCSQFTDQECQHCLSGKSSDLYAGELWPRCHSVGWRVRINAGSLSQGQLVALVSYVTQALVELLKLTNLITMLARAQACAGRINEVFAVTPSLEDGTDQAKLAPNAPVLELHDVSFAYPGAAGKALSHIDLTAQAGEVIGVIGGTGSGKSTLASLIMRFYDATEGSVCVGGKDVRTIERKSLRRSVGLVEQNPSLFSGTIASNLRWGNQKASEEDLMEAVATAQASDVINSRVEKLDATVEQFGRNFSGGQRQRLAIARTVVRRPAILILDDAASALDFATDAALRRSIAHDLHDTCTIIILSAFLPCVLPTRSWF